MHTKYSTIVDYAKRLKMQNIVKKRGLCGPRFLLCFYRSILTYPLKAGTCIGDISGFRIFYAEGKFYVCVTAGITEGTYTLGFATPGGILKTEPIVAFFVDILNLRIDNVGMVDSQFQRLSLLSGDIDPTNALGIRGKTDAPLLDLLAEGAQVNVPITVDNRDNNIILPVDNGGALCIGMFTMENITYDDIPYLMMVTRLV